MGDERLPSASPRSLENCERCQVFDVRQPSPRGFCSRWWCWRRRPVERWRSNSCQRLRSWSRRRCLAHLISSRLRTQYSGRRSPASQILGRYSGGGFLAASLIVAIVIQVRRLGTRIRAYWQSQMAAMVSAFWRAGRTNPCFIGPWTMTANGTRSTRRS